MRLLEICPPHRPAEASVSCEVSGDGEAATQVPVTYGFSSPAGFTTEKLEHFAEAPGPTAVQLQPLPDTGKKVPAVRLWQSDCSGAMRQATHVQRCAGVSRHAETRPGQLGLTSSRGSLVPLTLRKLGPLRSEGASPQRGQPTTQSQGLRRPCRGNEDGFVNAVNIRW